MLNSVEHWAFYDVSPTFVNLFYFIMSNRKTYKFTVSGNGYNYTETIEAVNPPEAKRLAEARYPGCRLYGFNQVFG